MAFPDMDFVSFLLLGALCGDGVTLVFTLVFTYVWFHVIAKSEAEEYDQAEQNRDDIKTIRNQAWLGVNMNLIPEFASGVFGAGMGLMVHSWFGWGVFGTLVVCIGVGAVIEVVFSFALPIFAYLIEAKMDKSQEGEERSNL